MKLSRLFWISFFFTACFLYPDSDETDRFLKQFLYKKFQVDIFGACKNADIKDLNSRINYDQKITIPPGQGQMQGQLDRLKRVYPLGVRLTYYIRQFFAVSIGFKYINQKQISGRIAKSFDNRNNSGEGLSTSYNLDDYTLWVRANNPFLGIHLGRRIGTRVEIEFLMAGGPVYASCGFHYNYASDWRWNNYQEVINYRLNEEGKGHGFAIELGAQLKYHLMRNVGVFLEYGWSSVKVNNISGPGELNYSQINRENGKEYVHGQNTINWQGQWKMYQLGLLYPTGGWEIGQVGKYSNDFHLNISGFELKGGLFIRF